MIAAAQWRCGLTIPIPTNHVAHWRATERGFEVEFLRFLTVADAKRRTPPWNKGLRTSWQERGNG